MLNSNNYYKGNDLINDNIREERKNLLNPYEYNFESNLKNKINSDITSQKTSCYSNRKTVKTRK